jgi:GT2 family glycosyltransferase
VSLHSFSFVFLTCNRLESLARALESVFRVSTDDRFEVIVVDNGSAVDLSTPLTERFPTVRCFSLADNTGVSVGRNFGAAQAMGEILIFIDDDAVLLTEDILERLSAYFSGNSGLALVAFKIVNDALDRVLSHEFPMKTFDEALVEREQKVGYFVGCGFAVRRSVFEKLGGFCPELFYGLEELDLSYRLIDQGFDILYSPSIVVRHSASPEVRRDDSWYYNMMKSRIVVVLRNLPMWAAVPHLLTWHVGLGVHAAWNGHLGSFLKGIADGWRMAGTAWGSRRPIQVTTARRIHSLSGRLFW